LGDLSLNGTDFFIISIFAYNSYIGLSNGLAKSVLGVGALIAAVLFAPVFQKPAASFLENYLNIKDDLTGLMGLGVSCFLIYLLLNFLISLFMKEVNKTALKSADKLAGLLVGALVSLFIIVTPLLIVNSLPILKQIPQVSFLLANSKFVPFFQDIGRPFQPVFDNAFREKREQLMKNILRTDVKKLPLKKGESKEDYLKRMMKEYNLEGLGPVNKTKNQKK